MKKLVEEKLVKFDIFDSIDEAASFTTSRVTGLIIGSLVTDLVYFRVTCIVYDEARVSKLRVGIVQNVREGRFDGPLAVAYATQIPSTEPPNVSTDCCGMREQQLAPPVAHSTHSHQYLTLLACQSFVDRCFCCNSIHPTTPRTRPYFAV